MTWKEATGFVFEGRTRPLRNQYTVTLSTTVLLSPRPHDGMTVLHFSEWSDTEITLFSVWPRNLS